MALMLVRMMTESGTYDPEAAVLAYQFWIDFGMPRDVLDIPD